MKIFITANLASNIYSRKNLLLALQNEGAFITACGCSDFGEALLINELGIPFISLPMENKGKSIFSDVYTFFAFYKLYKKEKPDIVLHYNSKPDIYGTLAASFLKIPSISNITGLGAIYGKKASVVRSVVSFLYTLAFKGSFSFVFFQNRDDQSLFIKSRIIKKEKCALLPGSGVDIKRFTPQKTDSFSPEIVFLFASRLLYSKGIIHFIEAAKQIKASQTDCRFIVIGELLEHEGFLTKEELDAAVHAGVIEYLGNLQNPYELIQKCNCMVLPSFYREGVPRILLEAAAMGKPLIAADSTGTREPVDHGVNGFLCKPDSTDDLVLQIRAFLELGEAQKIRMGLASRKIAETRYTDTIISDSYTTKIRELLKNEQVF